MNPTINRRRVLECVIATSLASVAGCVQDGDTVQDADGDGVIDSEDYAPRDPAVQRKSDLDPGNESPPTETSTETNHPTASGTATATETRTTSPAETPPDLTPTQTATGTDTPSSSATVSFTDQTAKDDGKEVTVDTVTLSDRGFVVVHIDDAVGEIFGPSGFLKPGTHENIHVHLRSASDKIIRRTTLYAVAYKDVDGDRTFQAVNDYRYVNGDPIDKATVYAP